jgi:hypothetical protein
VYVPLSYPQRSTSLTNGPLSFVWGPCLAWGLFSRLRLDLGG